MMKLKAGTNESKNYFWCFKSKLKEKFNTDL